MKLKLISILLLASLIPAVAIAEKTHIADTYPSLGRGVRPLGMGNAFLAMKGSDENALFYNPAAIRDYSNDMKWTTSMLPTFLPTAGALGAKIWLSNDRGKEARNAPYGLLAAPAEFNYAVFGLVKEVFEMKDDLDTSGTASGDIDVFNAFVDKHAGQFYSIETRLPLVGAYNRYLAVSLIGDSRTGISLRNRMFPNFEVRSTNIGGVSVGSAYGLFEDSLEIGAATKVLYGFENEQIITTSDILSNSMGNDFDIDNWKRGLGVGFDVGMKYEIYDFGQDWIDTLRPTIAATYQNIGDTKFRFMKKNGGPEPLPQSISAGIGVHPRIGEIETSVCVDFREINVKEDFLMKLNAGAEARFPERFGVKPSVRAGLNQGYMAFGGGVEVWKIVWNAAFFGKEVGETTRQKGGYRLASEMSFRF